MTDNLHIPQRLEGEQEIKSNPNWKKPQDGGVNSLEQVSLEAIIHVLIKRGLCTEAELLAEENRLRTSELWTSEETMTPMDFTPGQTQGKHRQQNHDGNRLRRWAAKRHWSRQFGTLFFGWTWHRKKREQKI